MIEEAPEYSVLNYRFVNRTSAIEVMYSYVSTTLSTKINNVFCYQLKDAYESTIPQHTSTIHEVNIFSNIIITVSFVLTLIRVYTTVWMDMKAPIDA